MLEGVGGANGVLGVLAWICGCYWSFSGCWEAFVGAKPRLKRVSGVLRFEGVWDARIACGTLGVVLGRLKTF